MALALLVWEDVEVGGSGQVGRSVRVEGGELALAVRHLETGDLLCERLELALLGLKALFLLSLLAKQGGKAPF